MISPSTFTVNFFGVLDEVLILIYTNILLHFCYKNMNIQCIFVLCIVLLARQSVTYFKKLSNLLIKLCLVQCRPFTVTDDTWSKSCLEADCL